MNYANINTNDWPVVTITFERKHLSESSFRAYLNENEKLFQIKKPFITIYDASEGGYISFKYQILQASWIKSNHHNIRLYSLFTIYVVKDIWAFIALKVILLFQPSPAKNKVVKSMTEAIRIAEEKVLAQTKED